MEKPNQSSRKKRKFRIGGKGIKRKPVTVLDSHLAEFAASGVSEELVLAGGVRSVSAEEAENYVGFPVGPGWSAPYGLPGDKEKTFCVKPDTPYTFSDGRAAKYLWPQGKPNRLYFPPGLEDIIKSPKVPLLITEGVKKALSAMEHGFKCVSIHGVWNFQKEGEAIPDLRGINWRNRLAYVVYDNDAACKESVRMAQLALALKLEKHDAKVRIVRIPGFGTDKKQGLDDFLVAEGIDALKELISASTSIEQYEALRIGETPQSDQAGEIERLIRHLIGRCTDLRLDRFITAIENELNVPREHLQQLVKQYTMQARFSKRARPEPIDKSAHIGLVGDFLDLVAPATEADPASLLTQFLTAFGNIIGRSAHFIVGKDVHYLKLFMVLVGRSAKARKGMSWAHVRECIGTVSLGWKETCIQSGLSSGEGLIYAVRDRRELILQRKTKKNPDGVRLDPGVKDKRLLVTEPEFAQVLKVMSREGNTLSTLIRQAWDGSRLQTITKGDPICASQSHISIIGHITEADLKRYLTATDAANGFANRFLWVCAARASILPEGGHVDIEAEKRLILEIRKAITFAKKIGVMKRSEKAVKLWDKIYRELAVEHDGMYGALTARAEPQIMRMACLYALLDMSSVVRVQHLKAAYAVWKYIDASIAYIFGSSLGDPIAARILANLLEREEGLTLSEIHDLFSRKKSAEQIQIALRALQEINSIYCVEESTGGRPVQRWRVR